MRGRGVAERERHEAAVDDMLTAPVHDERTTGAEIAFPMRVVLDVVRSSHPDEAEIHEMFVICGQLQARAVASLPVIKVLLHPCAT